MKRDYCVVYPNGTNRLKHREGTKKGSLTAIRPLGLNERTAVVWLTQCDCGAKVIREWSSFGKRTKSPACANCNAKRMAERLPSIAAKNPKWKGVGRVGGAILCTLKANAKVRKINVDVTIQDLSDLFEKQQGLCALTKLPLVAVGNRPTASVDRIDSGGHYTTDNIQWVHKDINIMKNSLPEDYFILICRKVAKATKSRKLSESDEGIAPNITYHKRLAIKENINAVSTNRRSRRSKETCIRT